jgi:O-antigen ligase
MAAKTETATKAVGIIVLFLLGLVLFGIPAGDVRTYVGGVPLSVGGNVHKIFPQFVIACLIYFCLQRKKVRWGVFAPPLLALGAVSLFSAASSMSPYKSLREGLRILFCAGFYVALINLPWGETRFRRILICFVVGIWFMAFRAGYGWVAGTEGRATAFHRHPNILGALSVIILPVVFLFAASVRERGWRILLHVTAGLLGFVIALTQSRSACLAMFGVFAFLALFGDRRVRRNLLPVSLALLVAIALAWKPVSSRFRQSAVELKREHPSSRMFIWDVTFLDAFPRLPLIGWGSDRGFAEAVRSREMFLTDRPSCSQLPHPHNQLLHVLTTTGLPGLLAWVWLALTFYLCIWRERKLLRRDHFLYLLAVTISIIVDCTFQVHLTTRNIFPAVVLVLVLAELLPRYQETIGSGSPIPLGESGHG